MKQLAEYHEMGMLPIFCLAFEKLNLPFTVMILHSYLGLSSVSFGCLLPEDGTESLSTATPRDSTEIDDTDQEKHLQPPKDGNLDIAFVKGAQK